MSPGSQGSESEPEPMAAGRSHPPDRASISSSPSLDVHRGSSVSRAHHQLPPSREKVPTVEVDLKSSPT